MVAVAIAPVVALEVATVWADAAEPVVGGPAVATDAPYGLRVQLVVVEGPGGLEQPRRLAELHTAQIGDPSWILNGVGDLSFTLPANDSTLLRCLVDPESVDPDTLDGEPMGIGREVQLWVNGEIRWAGVPVASEDDIDAGTVTYDCPDLGWYLSRRFMGAAERRDLLSGIGQMDVAGLPGWTRTTTCVRNTTTKVRGVGSMQMTSGGVAQATFIHPPHSNAGSISVYLTAMVRVQAGTPDGAVVMSINSYDGATEILRDPENNAATVSQETQRAAWSRFGCRALVPPEGCTVQVTLYNVDGGNRYFDDVRALKNDTTGSGDEVWDLCKHGVSLINHAQSEYQGKGSFGFKPRILYPSGTVERMGVRHLEHTQVLDLLNGYTDRDDGFDWWINPQTREVLFAARRGVDHVGLALTDHTVLGGGWQVDESERSSDIVVPGDGDPIDRPEGGYSNRSRTAGLALDWFHRPPNNTPLAALDPMARGVWRTKSQAQVSFRPIRVPGEWWPVLSVGDRFLTDFRNGVRRLPATSAFRVQRITHDLRADVLELA